MNVVRVRAAWVGLVAMSLVGCGGGDGLATVTGKVTFENEPVTEGRITFKMGGPTGKAYSAEIKDGSYTAQLAPGQAVVEVVASRSIPGKFDTTSNPGFKEPVSEMYIPARYNSATKLTAEIKSGRSELPPFDLKK